MLKGCVRYIFASLFCMYSNFSVWGCLPSIRKDFVTQMYGLAVYVKEGLLHRTNLQKTLKIITCNFDWLDFIMYFLFPLSITVFHLHDF